MKSGESGNKIEQIFKTTTAPQRAVPAKPVGRTAVKVARKQEANPILRSNKFAFTFEDGMPEDFDVSDKASVLFLSLQYHQAYPLYLAGRLEELYKAKRMKHKYLIVLHDIADEQNSINSITMQCFKFETTLLIAWSFEEAA